MDNESNFDIIRRHCFDDTTIPLNETQKKLLDRWNLVIELRTCERLRTKDIIQRLLETFDIERATAFNDISYAEALFGYHVTINKRYRIAARIEYLEELIDKLNQIGEFKAAALQELNLTRWYDQYPDIKKPTQARNLRFSYTSNQPLVEDLPTVQDAEFTLIEAAKKNV